MAWEQLADIMATARLEHDENVTRRPLACPNDGEPLKEGPTGALFCPCGDWDERHDRLPGR